MGTVKDISARLADKDEGQRLQEQGYIRVPTALGGLWHQPEHIRLGELVQIRLLGSPESYSIFVRGARAL